MSSYFGAFPLRSSFFDLALSQIAITMHSDNLVPMSGNVRVISRRRLREFWNSRKADARGAERDLSTWYKLAKHAEWDNFASLRQTFGSADQVGNCVVFDVGNNRFRLIGRVNFARNILYVLHVMDHAEYDKGGWIENCGCHRPPPKKGLITKPSAANRRKRR